MLIKGVTHPGRSSPMEDPLKFLPRLLTKLYSTWVSLTYPFASLGQKLSVHHTCSWRRSQAHRIQLGNFVQIRKDAIFHVDGAAAQSAAPAIIVDDDTCVGPHCHISARNRVHIERSVLVGQSVLIVDHRDELADAAGDVQPGLGQWGTVRIGEGSWIGYGAAIVCTSGELVLGRNCVVGANAVITRSYPPYSVIFGNPARVIRQFDQAKGAWVLRSA